MINFLNLEYFLVAAEELNFTRAAKKLFISQQSLSNHISNLEKEFDVVLFKDVYKRQAWNHPPAPTGHGCPHRTRIAAAGACARKAPSP